jgi:hypothetical protein
MVLIIHSSKKEARAISDIFYYMGVLSYAATPAEALTEISAIYRAVLVVDPEKLPDAQSLVEKLSSYNARIPIFALSDVQHDDGVFDKILPNDISSSKLIEEFVRFQNDRHLPLTSFYRLAGIDASCTLARVKVFDDPISFTKTETMILRYMIATYPVPKSAESILKYAFKPLRKPEVTSIRTHVSVMNKKFRRARGKNLFCSLAGRGYVMATPEILKSIKEENSIKA